MTSCQFSRYGWNNHFRIFPAFLQRHSSRISMDELECMNLSILRLIIYVLFFLFFVCDSSSIFDLFSLQILCNFLCDKS